MTGAPEIVPPDTTSLRAVHHVADQWRAGAPFALSALGPPAVALSLHPADHLIVMRTALVGPVPDVTHRRNLHVARLVVDEADVYELRLRVPGRDVEAAYALVTDTVNGMQLRGVDLATSLATALQRYDAVLGRATALSVERELGLIGELAVLRHLLHRGHDLGVWVGPAGEEHDFALSTGSVECKTTSGERRSHLISGTGQLTPSPGTPLHLVSMQYTRSADRGMTLTDRVEALRPLAGARVDELEALLHAAGWRDEDAGVYRTAWSLRTPPETYLVDDSFPRITDAALLNSPESGRIDQVTYRIDLTGLPPCTPPDPLIGLDDPQEQQ